ncbi:hypothetical protein ACQ5SO_03760 [Rhodovulum sp. DZ06]|uniref:hypothetical protein n=1 Tax=Rhodovulum sp. DZ06 TaxID=3425126 RepID=UPI003D340077
MTGTPDTGLIAARAAACIAELEEAWEPLFDDEDMPAHDAEAHAEVAAIIRRFAAKAGAADTRRAVKAELDEAVRALNDLDEARGGGLLETDEREIIVPALNAIAAAAGLELSDYDDGDPTLDLRMF